MQISKLKQRNLSITAAVLVLALTATSFSTFSTVSASGDEVIGGGRLGESGVIFDDTKGDGVAAPPDTSASSFIIADLDTGEILAAKNPHKKLPPASTLKTLTALTLLPRLDMNKIYVGTKKEPATIGNKVGIYPGRKYKIKDIWYGFMLDSGNDAGVALANASGGIKKTAALMQAKAKSIQAFDTTPKSPHGLDTPGQLSSAYDLALIARAAMDRSDFRKIVKTKRYTFPKSGPKNVNRKISNLNKLLFTYPGTLGVKTGWTTKGQNTYIGVVKRDGHTIIITFMHLKYGRDALAKELFDWGFKAIGEVEPVGKLV
jgi:serine-type D-Ala-D-Ala carboxypeptidase (penicillin-binding protein 5/6)